MLRNRLLHGLRSVLRINEMVIVCIIAAALLAGIDQALKYIAADKLADSPAVHVLTVGDTDILTLSYYQNNGAAFSSMQGKIPLLVVITVAFMAAMVFYLVKFKPKSKFAVACVIMVIGGGIGNLIDRVMLGYVIDYIILWPFKFIFNFADICVVVGAILVMIYYVFFDRENVEKHE